MQSQLITNQNQDQMCHNQDQMIARLKIQIEQLAKSVRGKSVRGERKDISLVKLCPTREDNLLLKILLQASLKLVLVQTVKSKPFTLYDQVREWTIKSKIHQTILTL